MRKPGKRFIQVCFIFMCLTLIQLTACDSGVGISQSVSNAPIPVPADGTPKASYTQQIYRLPWSEPSTFDPALSQDIYSNFVITAAFANLVRYDDSLQIQPYLAQSWQQSADGLEWTFHLHSNLTFSDGTHLTSKDIAYSLDRALQPSTKSPTAAGYLDLLKDAANLHAGRIKTIIGDSVITPDENTIVLTLNKKAEYFLYTLALPVAAVVEKRMIEKYGTDKLTIHLLEGGDSGPFILSKYIPNKEIDFTPNPYYCDLKPQLQELVLITDPTRNSYRDYQQGAAETTGVPLSMVSQVKTQYPNEFVQASRLDIDYLAMNFLAKPFDNLRIRQAFALSINREVLNHNLYSDQWIPTYHIIPQGMAGYNLNLTGPMGVKDSRGSFSLAKQLFQQGLREEGWSDISKMPPIKFTYATGDDQFMTLVTQMWHDTLGVNVIPDPQDFQKLLTEEAQARGNPNGIQFWSLGWTANYPDPHDWLTNHFGRGASQNYENYGQNNSADAIQEGVIQDQLAQADAESDPTRRLELYQSAEQQLVNQVAWIPLDQETRNQLLKPYVKGYIFNTLGVRPPDQWAKIYIAAH